MVVSPSSFFGLPAFRIYIHLYLVIRSVCREMICRARTKKGALNTPLLSLRI